jgi:L-ascorbate metabolism protein UlaG (beta-lactamase superfamily)
VFDVEYKGGNAVVITTKKSKLVVDPKLSGLGLKDVNTKDAVVIATEESLVAGTSDSSLVIDGPGEYEVGDFSIRGVAARRHIDTENDVNKATVYRVEIGDVRIAVLGNIDYRLNDDQLEEIGLVDIVIVPVGGGGYTLDATNAAALVRKIDCKVAIPVHYADKALHYEVPQEEVGVFVKEFGGEHEVTPKYKVKSAASVPTSTTVIEITRS